MVLLPARVNSLFHSSSRPQSPQPISQDAPSGSITSDHPSAGKPGPSIITAGRSKMASSCELFGMLRAMAAGISPVDSAPDVDDLEEDEELEETAQGPLGSSQRRGSSATIVPQPPPFDTTREADSDVDEATQRQKLEEWMQESLGKTSLQQETLSSQLAALSMSNVSPLVSDEHASRHRKRPELPTHISEPAGDYDHDFDSILSTESTGITTPSETGEESEYPNILGTENIPEDEKLKAIEDEFGNIAGLLEPPLGENTAESERMLAESKGSLFKGIMLIGNLHLTTHRLLFHALLPPDASFVAPKVPSEEGADAAYTSTTHQPDVLMAGPVTLHRSARLKVPRRVWMELSAEMMTWYPNGNETGRVRPLRSILLSSIQRMEPFDPEYPCDFHMFYETPSSTRSIFFTIDTEQSAAQWRREIEGALFRHAHRRWRDNHTNTSAEDWSTMRCCLPLDRVTINGIDDYHHFATLVSLDIESGDQYSDFSPSIAMLEEPSTPSLEKEVKSKLSSFKDRTSHFANIKSGESSREASPSRRNLLSRHGSESKTPPRSTSTSSQREPITYINSALPPRLAHGMDVPRASHESQTLSPVTYKFNVAVLNEQRWFAQALQAAVVAARNRRYRAGTVRPRMTLDVGGYDCLKTDEDLDHEGSGTSMNSEHNEEDDGHGLSMQIRKAEKISLAARIFGLQEDEEIWIKRCYMTIGLLPFRGHIIITPRYVCFWRRAAIGADIKYRFPATDIKGADTAPGLRTAFQGMTLNLHGQSPVRFEFWSKASRDEVTARIQALSNLTHVDPQSIHASTSVTDQSILHVGRTDTPLEFHAADILAPPKHTMLESRAFPDEALAYMPFVANKPSNVYSRLTPRHFVCLTIGSRGDVQPYIALGLRLKQDGHRVTIVTHDEFKLWIEGYGIGHRQAGGDPTALMKLSAEHKMFSPGFFRESLGSFRQWLEDLLLDSWHACHDADVLIESPSAMAGIHIAEALRIPYFRAFTMPWTRTTAYPQAFMVPAFEMGPSFNYSTYVLFDNIMWRATSGQINRWRKKALDLKATDMSALSITKVTFLYNFSPAVVPKPLDWHDDISITGYWYLEDSDSEWKPPSDLELFMARAAEDGKPLVYIGFGSIVVPRPNAMTKSIIRAVEKAGVRAIIAKGWSSRGANPAEEGAEIDFPSSCYGLDKVPHGWLFPRVNAALHHGGAGTVGASLRAGIPTLIKPWFGDQFFWAARVAKLEVGVKVSSLRSDDIADALIRATTSKVMIDKAARIGARIRAENGVENAIRAIHNNIGRAGSDRTKMQWAR